MKKSCHLVLKVVIDLPFVGRKVEGSQKNNSRKSVPQVGSRGEKTIIEPTDSWVETLDTIIVRK